LAGSSLYRFTKEKRLLDAAAYGRVFKNAARSRDKWFTVLCRENDGRAGRLGLAISKKHCRAATQRNRIKRVVRESFRRHQSMLASLDIVVLNQPGARDGSNQQLTESLERHWQQCARGKVEQGTQG
jgi:ribonuclease P protein component